MARKSPWWVSALPLLIAVIVLGCFFILSQHDGYRVHLGGHTYHLEPATTVAEQEKGLGGRSSLASDEGMLFIFPDQSRLCFWMKDMRFPIDIIWTVGSKRVARIEHALTPATYPKEYCASARYVIELNAGVTARAGLLIGQQLSF